MERRMTITIGNVTTLCQQLMYSICHCCSLSSTQQSTNNNNNIPMVTLHFGRTKTWFTRSLSRGLFFFFFLFDILSFFGHHWQRLRCVHCVCVCVCILQNGKQQTAIIAHYRQWTMSVSRNANCVANVCLLTTKPTQPINRPSRCLYVRNDTLHSFEWRWHSLLSCPISIDIILFSYPVRLSNVYRSPFMAITIVNWLDQCTSWIGTWLQMGKQETTRPITMSANAWHPTANAPNDDQMRQMSNN